MSSKWFLFNNQPDALIIRILLCYKTPHVSAIFSVHHRQFSTVHSALVIFMQVFDDRFQAESEWCVSRGPSRADHRAVPGSNSSLSVWYLWRTKWHSDRPSPVSIFPLILPAHSFNVSYWQHWYITASTPVMRPESLYKLSFFSLVC